MAKYRCSVCGYIYDEEQGRGPVLKNERMPGLSSAGGQILLCMKKRKVYQNWRHKN